MTEHSRTKLYQLGEIEAYDRSEVGDRAWYLSQLARLGYPVLPGAVIGNSIRQQFLRSITWSDRRSDPLLADFPDSSFHIPGDRSGQLREIARTIRDRIVTTPLPAFLTSELWQRVDRWQSPWLLCRSSLSLPGKTDTPSVTFWQPVIVRAEATALARGIQQIWAESFSSKSLLYWQHLEIELARTIVGVLIQPFDDRSIGGTIALNGPRAVVRSTWGLGLALGQPELDSDRFSIQLHPYQLQEQELGQKSIVYGLGQDSDRLQEATSRKRTPIASLASHKSPDLQSYALEEPWSQEFSLETTDLRQLADRMTPLVSQWSAGVSFEWIGKPSVNWHITDVVPHQVGGTQLSQRPLQGLGAAPGIAVGSAVVVSAGDRSGSQKQPNAAIVAGKILVAEALSLENLWMVTQARGLIIEQGGLTNHAAILARELGIPAIVAVPKATTNLRTGDRLRMDGTAGDIKGISEIESQSDSSGRPSIESEEPRSSHPQGTQVWVNLSQPRSIALASQLNVDGVGLLRAELLAATCSPLGNGDRFITQWAEHLQQFARAFFPRPVYYRSFDRWFATSDCPRGAMAYRVNTPSSKSFELELQALEELHRRGDRNIHLLLPFVRAVEDVAYVRDRIKRYRLSEMQLWMMVEVPAVLFGIADFVTAGIDGFSLGTNDLIPLLLGSDRYTAPESLSSNLNRGVMNGLQHCIAAAKSAGVPCSICGQATMNYPHLIGDLVSWGITSISVDLHSVPRVRDAITHIPHDKM
ncbi:putative PEP-binding protein [Roseofilum casamattae]|uniref:Phosphoenolpyruvate synthase n=1 Tax=Roseofilum casamattae BLCC-M143 TaxID=3022442 RepID=A0ABT7C3P6_9CYAN|nr:putative PEP-binding protein [Roseofilum casamattae]MDJ1185419.1 PEP-utilizing enzyme [Roseofilum casamattae BLCC-M143]